MTIFVGSEAANLQCWVTLKHFTLSEETLAESIIGRITREVCKGDSVVSKTKITVNLSADNIF